MIMALLVGSPAQQCAAEIPAPLLACTAEPDAAKRLACFDRAVAQMGESAEPATPARAAAPVAQPAPAGSQPTSAAAAVSAAPPVAAAPAVAAAQPSATTSPPPSLSPEEDFGLRTKRDRPSQQLDELTAKAAEIKSKPHGELVVTLDNGQVWAEIAPGKIKLKPGDPVRIEAGTLGSFILIAPNGRSSKVVRVH
jgi:hypothetical protein